MENVPLMQKKGDIKLNISTSNLQTSYALTNNIAIMVNGYIRGNKYTDDFFCPYKSKRLLAEVGAGYFMLFPNKIIFEAYGGAGYGNVNIKRDFEDYMFINKSGTFSANISRYFIQPNIGYKNDIVELAFSSRFTCLKFSDIKTKDITYEDLVAKKLYQVDVPTYFFVEPALTVRVGFKWVKAHFQIMYSTKLNSEPLNYLDFGFNIGICFDISKALRK